MKRIPMFYWGFFISYVGHKRLELTLDENYRLLLSIESRESFLKAQDVQWICWLNITATRSQL
jgi:hypothetical protein